VSNFKVRKRLGIKGDLTNGGKAAAEEKVIGDNFVIGGLKKKSMEMNCRGGGNVEYA